MFFLGLYADLTENSNKLQMCQLFKKLSPKFNDSSSLSYRNRQLYFLPCQLQLVCAKKFHFHSQKCCLHSTLQCMYKESIYLVLPQRQLETGSLSYQRSATKEYTAGKKVQNLLENNTELFIYCCCSSTLYIENNNKKNFL